MNENPHFNWISASMADARKSRGSFCIRENLENYVLRLASRGPGGVAGKCRGLKEALAVANKEISELKAKAAYREYWGS